MTPIDAVIKVHFSEFIKPGSSDDITVSGGAAGDILRVAGSTARLTLTPSMLEFSTTYTVFIPAEP